MQEFLKFILQQVLEIDNLECTISSSKITIKSKVNFKIYQEEIFDENSKFTKKEIQELVFFSSKVINNNSISDIKNIPILKTWYLITHEKYFKDLKTYDKHDRVSSKSLVDGFHEILKIPICDVLKLELNKILNNEFKNNKTYYLTCDYDFLNIWDIWGVINLLKEFIYYLLNLKIKRSLKLILSYLFSRRAKFFNGYLNTKMYLFGNKEFRNIGFFISDPLNKSKDGYFSYNNLPVKYYLKKLRKNSVEFGLHTNYDSFSKKNIDNQVLKFKKLFNEFPRFNRHHFLRFKFPDYLHKLDAHKIETDFSIYFPESLLFRCGISSSFKVWNTKNSKPFSTKVLPITLMDGTFSDYYNCDYNTANKLAKTKLNYALKYGSEIVLLWHNSTTFKDSHLRKNYHPKLVKSLIKHLETHREKDVLK